jgi:hypothetical protein
MLLLLSLCTRAGQDTTAANRTAYRLVLAIADAAVYKLDVKAGPYLDSNNTLQLFPGETVFIEVEKNGSTITAMKAVRKNFNPGKTLVINFRQVTEGTFHKRMQLDIENPFDENLYCSAMMGIILRKKWEMTVVPPVPAKAACRQIWPQVVVSIMLNGWVFAK